MILFRGRRFFMPDIHPYFKDAKEAWLWYPKLEEKLKESFNLAGREYLNIVNVSSKKNWEKYKKEILKIAINNEKEILVDIKGDKEEKYWIVDIDFGIIDKLEQFREIACIQIDLGNAERLGIKYSGKNGKVSYPAIIHSAIPGGIERYIYMLVDNYESFPIDFQPIQLRIIPVGEKFNKDALKMVKKYSNLRIDIDDKAESVSKRLKRAHEEKIPNILIFGEKEKKDEKKIMIFKEIQEQINKKVPFIPIGWPICLSKRVG
jgi:threonyl-tRNA synthetase